MSVKYFKNTIYKIGWNEIFATRTSSPSAEPGFFWRPPWLFRNNMRLLLDIQLHLSSLFFSTVFSEIWRLELDKLQNVLMLCLFIRRPWLSITFMPRLLLLKEQPKLHCCARWNGFQVITVVSRDVPEMSGPSKLPFISAVCLDFIFKIKQTSGEKS